MESPGNSSHQQSLLSTSSCNTHTVPKYCSRFHGADNGFYSGIFYLKMPQVASKSGYAKPFPLPLSCSYLLGEIQQLSDSSQQLMAGQGGGGCRQSGSRRRSRKHLTQAGTEQWHGYSFSQNCHQLTSSPLPQQQSGGIWAWLHIKLSAHHYPNTSNSSCWW